MPQAVSLRYCLRHFFCADRRRACRTLDGNRKYPLGFFGGLGCSPTSGKRIACRTMSEAKLSKRISLSIACKAFASVLSSPLAGTYRRNASTWDAFQKFVLKFDAVEPVWWESHAAQNFILLNQLGASTEFLNFCVNFVRSILKFLL